MAKQNKKVAEVSVKTKKSSVRVRSIHDAKPFLTYKPDEVKKLYELTEEELIAEGYRFQLVKRPDFSKTKQERKELEEKKFKVSYRTPSVPPLNVRATPKRCVVELQSVERFNGKNPSDFHNIKSAILRPFEIVGFIDSLNTKKATVIRYTYDGKTVEIEKEK